MQFTDLGLAKPILDAVTAQGYTVPTPIQAQAIPAVMQGQDVMAAAQTGTGKTAGFTLPILHLLNNGQRARSNKCRALVLTPTRELAAQVEENVNAYAKNTPLRSAVVFGGVKINPQLQKLRSGVDVLVATPGRLLDLYQQNAIRFDQLEVLVLDEADRMLDMGFIRDIKKIINLLPAKRQNLLFSATFSDEIRELAKGLVNNPVEISVTPRNATAKSVEQIVHPVDKKRKPLLLAQLIGENNWQQVLVFTRTKHGANKLTKYLQEFSITAAAIHGNKSQGARTRALAEFKSGDVRALVATDIAARGLDIDQLPQVVNYELPQVAEDYVHRIGRTGRAGATGHAISLVCADEWEQMVAIEQLTQKHLEREMVAGFEPQNPLDDSKPIRPLKAKKPKKPKKPAGNEHNSDGTETKAAAPRRRKPQANRNGQGAHSGDAKPTGGQRRGGGGQRTGASSGGEGQRNGNRNSGGRSQGSGNRSRRSD
ncbi:DEAD/DEAH box helicase [Ferrimonas lipolytica]|uniref:ATP-dependent RNA helicase RhlE n=1 Tax=Ferrimonas lipolytica TaxID=2724191 RepID=A0A6H1UJT7_9GAMM|nr:DEAD/DEAH box helicase [Ferrimonas lipolytica]QIZ78889.1 DEAD/DEAH box helicase [Ferrimonas lipolytica]